MGLPTQALGGDESSAPSHPGSKLDGSHMPFGSTAAHDPTGSEILRVEVEVPGWTMNKKNDWDEHPGTNGFPGVEIDWIKKGLFGLGYFYLNMRSLFGFSSGSSGSSARPSAYSEGHIMSAPSSMKASDVDT